MEASCLLSTLPTNKPDKKKRNEQKALRIERHKTEKGLKVLGADTFFEVRS